MKELETYTLTMVREIADKAHAAGRREAWEKMRESCEFSTTGTIIAKPDLCIIKRDWQPCAYDTCPLLQDGEK